MKTLSLRSPTPLASAIRPHPSLSFAAFPASVVATSLFSGRDLVRRKASGLAYAANRPTVAGMQREPLPALEPLRRGLSLAGCSSFALLRVERLWPCASLPPCGPMGLRPVMRSAIVKAVSRQPGDASRCLGPPSQWDHLAHRLDAWGRRGSRRASGELRDGLRRETWDVLCRRGWSKGNAI
jgi:hypothetical protein